MVHNVVMNINSFLPREKACIVHCLPTTKQAAKNSNSLVTWHMPGYFYLS